MMLQIRVLLLALSCAPSICAAGNDLPEGPDGTLLLPQVVATLGTGWVKVLFGQSMSAVLYERAGAKIDTALAALDIDHKNQAGTYYAQIIFKVSNVPFPIKVPFDKKKGETMKQALKREFAEGKLPGVGTDETLSLTKQDIRDFAHRWPGFQYQVSSGGTALFGGIYGSGITPRTGHVIISNCPGGVCGEDAPEIH